MSNQEKHIGIFEELIRVLNLKQHTHCEKVEDFIPSFDRILIPDSQKSQKILHELIEHQNKINRRKANRKIYFSLIITSILLSSLFLFDQIFNKSEKQNLNILSGQEQDLYLMNDSILLVSDTTSNLNSHFNKIHTNYPYRIRQIETDTIQVSSADSAQKNDNVTNILVKDKLSIDTTQISENKSDNHSGTVCPNPKIYRLEFDESSAMVAGKYDKEIKDLANYILYCTNLQKFEITGYYNQRFVFFNNKKLVQKRFENIKKEIRKQNVPSRTLRKFKENLIKTSNSYTADSSRFVIIILKE